MVLAIRAADADVVHFHGARSLHAMFAATTLRARQQRLPLVAQDHGPRLVGPVMRRLQLAALRRCDALLAANGESRAEFEAKAPAVEVHTVPNGVDPLLFEPDESRGHAAPLRILVVSRLMADKDPLTMARAVAEVAQRGCRVEVTVVGVGELRRSVEDLLRAGSVPATFIDIVSQAELADYYRAAHVLVLSSLREGFNQATIEAMACGTPVVASDIPGIREGVAGAGLLVPPGDVQGFADHLQALARDEQVWKECRARCLVRAAQYRWPTIADQLEGIYRKAMAR
jgi:glycosyltransferase involved in cell wall biosynthesis